MSVLSAQVCHWRLAAERHVFNPFVHFLYGAATYVSADVRFATKLIAQAHELVSTEAVVFYNAAPVCVDHALAVFLRTNAIFPMVFVCKASTRPAKVRDINVFECLNNVLSVTVNVRDW